MRQAAVVLCAHGSRAPETAPAHRELCTQLADDLGVPVLAGFLEIDQPDIPTAVDDAVSAGAARVILLPYFLHAGNHTTRDLPAIIAGARARHPGVQVELAAPLAPDPRLLAICADRARAALAAAPTSAH